MPAEAADELTGQLLVSRLVSSCVALRNGVLQQ